MSRLIIVSIKLSTLTGEYDQEMPQSQINLWHHKIEEPDHHDTHVHYFEVYIRICQTENSDVHLGEGFLWIFMSFFCLVFAMPLCASVYMCLVVTCWERAILLALICGVLL